MPKLVCPACGRELYTTSPVAQLFADERRCPRCGKALQDDHRKVDRRTTNRRENPPDELGPPETIERRVGERRQGRRRKRDTESGRRDSSGWTE